MDVPASRLVRRTGRLPPEVLRIRHSRSIPMDPAGVGCQLCGEHERVVVLEPVVDPNGQRITVALCLPCLRRGVALFDEPPPLPARPRRRAEKR